MRSKASVGSSLWRRRSLDVAFGPLRTDFLEIWGVGFVLGGILLVALARRLPRKEPGLRHTVVSERDGNRRYVPVCSCGWVGEPEETIEGLLLASRAHKAQAARAATCRVVLRKVPLGVAPPRGGRFPEPPAR